MLSDLRIRSANKPGYTSLNIHYPLKNNLSAWTVQLTVHSPFINENDSFQRLNLRAKLVLIQFSAIQSQQSTRLA